LADCCRKEFSSQDVRRGVAYFANDAVQIVSVDGTVLIAQVSGSRASPYDVILDWKSAARRILEVSCSCPRFGDEGLCKHVFATILAADEQGVVPAGLKGRFEVYDLDDGDYDQFDVYEDDEDEDEDEGADEDSASDLRTKQRIVSFVRRSSTAKKPPSPPAQPQPWQKQLALVKAETSRLASDEDRFASAAGMAGKPRQAWFLFDPRECTTSGALVIRFCTRELKKNGEPGKLKTLNLNRAQLAKFADAEDRSAIELFFGIVPSVDYSYGYSYGGYRASNYQEFASCELSPALCGVILPRICARGRLLWSESRPQWRSGWSEEGRLVAWDEGPAWQFRLHFDLDDKQKNWLVTGRLHRGDEQADISRPTMVLPTGLMLVDDRLARVDWGGGFSWALSLRKQGPIVVPRAKEQEMLEQFWQLPSIPAVEMPTELRWEQVTIEPRARIAIKKPRQRWGGSDLYGAVTFDYDGRTVRADDEAANLVDRAARRVIRRDLPAEQSLLTQALNLGFKRSLYNRDDGDLTLRSKDLPRVVPELMKAGWQVDADGKLFRKAGEFELSVSSGVDWFDLEASCDFEGLRVGLPKLLEALRQGQSFVMLDDGSQGMLPESWLKKFAPLASLGEAQGDAVRFRSSQAMFLDALLASQPEVKVDARFEKARAKLRGFAGVHAREQPSGFVGQLREYQQLGLGWLRFLQDFGFGGCLADDMGLGKTIQVLALLEERRTRRATPGEPRAPSLVVAPKSLVHNWVEEAARFAPRLRVLDYTGLARAGKLGDLSQVDLIVTTYATMRLDILKFKDVRFDYAILDEAQAAKNSNSQTAKACRLLQADYRLAMTGTPVENHLGELWSIFEFLNPGMLGRSEAFKAFSSGGRGAPAEALQLLAQALRPFLLRRTKEQVLTELPAKTEQTLYCELDAPQRKAYDELRNHYRASLDDRIKLQGLKRSKIHVLEALLRLRQAACHQGLIDKKQIKLPSAKLDTLLEQLAEVLDGGHKALVFSQFTSLLDIVRQRLDADKIGYAYLDGKTRARKDVVERFQTDDACRLFLISLKAGGLGLNLTAADYVFILDPWWNPAVEAQAVDRAHRLGQTRPVFAYRLVARDTVEEKILELQGKKRELADAIISADDSLISQLTADDLRMLLS